MVSSISQQVDSSGTIKTTNYLDYVYVAEPSDNSLADAGLGDPSGLDPTSVAPNFTQTLDVAKPEFTQVDISGPSTGYAPVVQSESVTDYSAGGNVLYSLTGVAPDPSLAGAWLAQGTANTYTNSTQNTAPGEVDLTQQVTAIITASGQVTGAALEATLSTDGYYGTSDYTYNGTSEQWVPDAGALYGARSSQPTQQVRKRSTPTTPPGRPCFNMFTRLGLLPRERRSTAGSVRPASMIRLAD